MSRPKFTQQDGLTVQTKHLMEWKEVLKPEVYEKLEAYVLKKNDELPSWADGYHVFRGSDILTAIENRDYKLGDGELCLK